jgi:P27 family predicted phage terminase small subunit
MRGRKPIPTQTHILRGTFGSRQRARAAGEVKPELVAEVPAPPAGLGKHGRDLWASLASELVEKQLLTVLDVSTLEILCAAWQTYKECQDAIYRRPGGKRRTLAQYMLGKSQQTSLELSTMHWAFGTYKSLMSEFGLSPSSRTRLPIAPQNPKDDFADLDDDPMETLLKAP